MFFAPPANFRVDTTGGTGIYFIIMTESGHSVKVLAVTGPTATGKTALAVRLARVFGGEVAKALFERGVCLPSGTGLKSGDFARIAACLG